MNAMPDLPPIVWVDVRDLTVHFSNENDDPFMKKHVSAYKAKSMDVLERNKFIADNYGKLSAETICSATGLTKGSLMTIACNLGVTRKRRG